MELILQRDELLPKLESLQNITNTQTTMPILNFVLIREEEPGKVMLIGNNLEAALGVMIPANIIESGTAVLPSRKFYEMVREMPDGSTFTLKIDEKYKISIEYPYGNYRLYGLDPDEFPRIPEVTEVNSKIEGHALTSLLSNTLFAAPVGDVNYALNGINFDIDSNGITACGAESRRIAVAETKAIADQDEEPISFIVPSTSARELQNIFADSEEVYYLLNEGRLVVTDKDSIFITSLIDGSFPDYKRIISAVYDNKIFINKDSLIRAIRRVDLVADPNTLSILVIIKGETLTLQVKTPDIGEANTVTELREPFEGKPTVFRFHSKMLIDGLSQIKTEYVQIVFGTLIEHIYLYPDEDITSETYFNLVMPLVLQESEAEVVLAQLEETSVNEPSLLEQNDEEDEELESDEDEDEDEDAEDAEQTEMPF